MEAAFIKQNETINQKEAFSEVGYFISDGISFPQNSQKIYTDVIFFYIRFVR